MEEHQDRQEPEVFSVRFSSEVAAQAKAEAARLGISLNAFLKMLLAQYFDGIVFQRKPSSPPFASGSAAQAPAPGESPTRAGAES